MKLTRRSQRIILPAFAALAIGLLGASCGDDDDATTGATTSAAAATTTTGGDTSTTEASGTTAAGDGCEAGANLRTSIEDLSDIDISEGVAGIQEKLGDIRDDLEALRSSAGDELEPQVQEVQDALDELETALGDLGSGGAGAAVSAVSNLVSAGQDLVQSLDDLCEDGTTTTT